MYQFDFIKDSRFTDTPKTDINSCHNRLIKKLTGLPVKLKFSRLRVLNFGEPEPCRSFRRTYYISKSSRKITWNTVFGIINTIQAPYYKRV